jgi:hypothetical protein
MARILVQIVFPILLPALLYALWLAAERRRLETAGGGQRPGWAEAPWFWLLALGVFFAGIIAVAVALFGGESIEGVYVPPQIKDGRVVPGHVEPPAR